MSKKTYPGNGEDNFHSGCAPMTVTIISLTVFTWVVGVDVALIAIRLMEYRRRRARQRYVICAYDLIKMWITNR